MSIGNKPFNATVKKLVHHEKYTQAQLTTSRKNYKFNEDEEVDSKTNPKYLYSVWGFVTFLGEAHNFMVTDVEEGDLVTITGWSFTHEPYEEDGVTKWGAPKLTVFNMEMNKKASGKPVQHASDGDEEDWAD